MFHDLLSVCKRHTKLTVADLLKIIATDSDTLAQTAQEHAASNVDAEIPVNLCPANLLYKVLCIKHPDILVGDQPRPLKRPAASAGSAAIANASDVERKDEEDAAEEVLDGAPDVGSVGSGGSAPSRRRRWALDFLAAAEVPAAPSKEGIAIAKARTKTVPMTKPRRRIYRKTADTSSSARTL